MSTSFNAAESERIAAALTASKQTVYEFLRVAALERADRVLVNKEK